MPIYLYNLNSNEVLQQALQPDPDKIACKDELILMTSEQKLAKKLCKTVNSRFCGAFDLPAAWMLINMSQKDVVQLMLSCDVIKYSYTPRPSFFKTLRQVAESYV